MIFDGDCNFCRFWIRRWQQTSGDRVEHIPFQDPCVAVRFPEIPRLRFESAVQLIGSDGSVYQGAEAAFSALAQNPRAARFLRWYVRVPLFARAAELAYSFVARHRTF